MTTIIPWSATAACLIAGKFSPVTIGNARTCKGAMQDIFPLILRARSLCSKRGGRCRPRGVLDTVDMKKLLLSWVIAGAALAGMAGCAQIKKPAQVRAV